MIQSFLDQDYYTLTVGQFIYHNYKDVDVTYRFINRNDSDKFDYGFFYRLAEKLDAMQGLQLTAAEFNYLKNLGVFSEEYLGFLSKYRYDPKQITADVTNNQLNLTITGKSQDAIMWEVPVLALISEAFFEKRPASLVNYKDWTLTKREKLDELQFCEFGTRRRRSPQFQAIALEALLGSPGLVGTSNLHLSRLMGLNPVGTQSHQLFMGLSAFYNIYEVNYEALRQWANFYKGKLGVALTDTFGTDNFLENFDWELSRIYNGVRQDSGDPNEFTNKIVSHYNKLGVDTKTKSIYYSNQLTPAKCQDIYYNNSASYINKIFCIGTNLTNDVVGEPPLNIVIKLATVNGKNVVKLTDTPGKETGVPEEVAHVKSLLAQRT
jgi:nicotinate phosphoribosyltransferase